MIGCGGPCSCTGRCLQVGTAIPVPQRPHRCPVCGGTGSVDSGFYGVATSTASVTCRACGGRGVIIA